MTLGWSVRSLAVFDAVAAVVSARDPRGLTMQQLSAVGALARELDKPEPDPARVEAFLAALELEEEDLEDLTEPTTTE